MINVQTIINDAVQKNNVRTGLKRDGAKFHISDAGNCYRQRYLKRLGVERQRDIPVGNLRKMLAGDAGHEKLQQLLREQRKLFSSESVIETEHIKGHYDGILKDGDSKTVLEIKTIEKWAMGYIKSGGPKKNHIIQMFTYWKFLREDYTNLDQAILFYVKREDFEGVPFNFLWSQEIEDKVEKEWAPLLDYWTRGELPPCTCHADYDGNGVKYCNYPTLNEAGDVIGCCDASLAETVKKEVTV